MPPPRPYVDDSANPVPNSTTPLYLISEHVVFHINKYVQVSGNFTICNPSNSTVDQTILFPFYKHESNGVPGYMRPDYLSVIVNDSEVIYEYDNKNSNQPAITFNITVHPNEKQNISITYQTYYGYLNYTEAQLTYITTSAREWHRPIEHAFFEFIFNRSAIVGEPLGGDETIIGKGSVMTTVERTDWTPDSNITITWNSTIEPYEPRHVSDGTDERDEGDAGNDGRICTLFLFSIIFICSIAVLVILVRKQE